MGELQEAEFQQRVSAEFARDNDEDCTTSGTDSLSRSRSVADVLLQSSGSAPEDLLGLSFHELTDVSLPISLPEAFNVGFDPALDEWEEVGCILK
jgi:hypothetical protein